MKRPYRATKALVKTLVELQQAYDSFDRLDRSIPQEKRTDGNGRPDLHVMGRISKLSITANRKQSDAYLRLANAGVPPKKAQQIITQVTRGAWDEDRVFLEVHREMEAAG